VNHQGPIEPVLIATWHHALDDWDAPEDIPCASVEQQRLILIHRDRLEDALEEQPIAELSEQLAHPLAALINAGETPGDVRELLLACLRGDPG
jgi:hypothetical protein